MEEEYEYLSDDGKDEDDGLQAALLLQQSTDVEGKNAVSGQMAMQ